MRHLPKEYFQNIQEQNRIKVALTSAIPVGVYYHNLILALTEILMRAVQDAYKKEVYTKPVEDKAEKTPDEP